LQRTPGCGEWASGKTSQNLEQEGIASLAAETTRRTFVKGSVMASAGALLSLRSAAAAAPAQPASAPRSTGALPKGKIGGLEVSRL
jgi:hypothetical protein